MQIKQHTQQIIFIIFLFIFSLIGVGGSFNAYASPSGATSFEQQSVLEDLRGSTLNGKEFNQSDYQPSKIKNLQLINFVEYGYFSESKAYFNLYFYIYNPQELDLDFESEKNRINFRIGGNASDNYNKYSVELLNSSEVLYKYKVTLNASQRTSILAKLSSDNRVYEVAGVELLTVGELNAKDYDVKTKFTYKGEGENLNCSNEASLALTLDVHNTNYRASGSNGNSNHTQDTLHSVYFSIPNEIKNEYGDMSAVHAEWINALTKPMLVVGDWNYYNIFLDNAINDTWTKYLIFGNLRMQRHLNTTGQLIRSIDYYGDWVFNHTMYTSDIWAFKGTYYIDNPLNDLPIVIYANGGNASTYTVRSNELINYFKNYNGDDKVVASKYSSELFESYDTEFTEINKTADEEFKLTSQEVNQNFWEWLFGLEGSNIVSNEEFKTKAIVEVKPEHFKNTIAETCKELLIGESDYAEFKEFYDSKKGEETVYLFRYYQSEYKSEKADIMDRTESYFMGFEVEYGFYLIESICDNAYFAQEEVQLDFDIIDITCTKGNVVTVIGIVATPLDNFSPVTPPLAYYENDFWKYAAVIVGVLVVIFFTILIFAKFNDNNNNNEDLHKSQYYKKE